MRYLINALLIVLIPSPGLSQASHTGMQRKPFSIGWTETIDSKILGQQRVVNIYLPEGYSSADTVRYPVIYLLDGSANEDFIHIAGLVQFASMDWVQQCPKSIIVGIANIDRKKDFTFPTGIKLNENTFPASGNSAAFISFIQRELQPFINEHYSTTNDKTIIGQSLGGLLAAEIFLRHRSLFNRYILISPSLWWDNGSLLTQAPSLLSNKPSLPSEVYIAVGKEGLTPFEPARVMEVDANLFADALQKHADHTRVHFDYLPAENHGNIMHQAVYNAFKWLYASNNH